MPWWCASERQRGRRPAGPGGGPRPLAHPEPARRGECDHPRRAEPDDRAPPGRERVARRAGHRAHRVRGAALLHRRGPAGGTGRAGPEAGWRARTGRRGRGPHDPHRDPTAHRGDARLREADPRRGERDRRRWGRGDGPGLRPGRGGGERPADPGVRAPRADPRRRGHVPAAAPRRAPESEGARVLRGRPRGCGRGADRSREQGRRRRRSSRPPPASGRRASRRDRPAPSDSRSGS